MCTICGVLLKGVGSNLGLLIGHVYLYSVGCVANSIRIIGYWSFSTKKYCLGSCLTYSYTPAAT